MSVNSPLTPVAVEGVYVVKEPPTIFDRIPMSVTAGFIFIVCLLSTAICWNAMTRVSHIIGDEDDRATSNHHHDGGAQKSEDQFKNRDSSEEPSGIEEDDRHHHHQGHHHGEHGDGVGGAKKRYSHGMLQRVVEGAMTELHRRRGHGHHHQHQHEGADHTQQPEAPPIPQ